MRAHRAYRSSTPRRCVAPLPRASRWLRCTIAGMTLLASLPGWTIAQGIQPSAATRASLESVAAPRIDSLPGAFFVERRAIAEPVVTARRAREAPLWAPALSALVPGAGQAVLDQDRWIAYAAVELMAWLRYASDHSEAQSEQRRYRNIAANVARALYSTGTPPEGS